MKKPKTKFYDPFLRVKFNQGGGGGGEESIQMIHYWKNTGRERVKLTSFQPFTVNGEHISVLRNQTK